MNFMELMFGTNKCSNSQEASTAMMTQYPVIGSSAFYQLSILSGLRSFTVDELSNHFTRCYQKSLASFELRRTYYNRNKCEFQYMFTLAISPCTVITQQRQPASSVSQDSPIFSMLQWKTQLE